MRATVISDLVNHNKTLIFHFMRIIFIGAFEVNMRQVLSHTILVSALGARELGNRSYVSNDFKCGKENNATAVPWHYHVCLH